MKLYARTMSIFEYVRQLLSINPQMSLNQAKAIAVGSKRVRVSICKPHQNTKECERRKRQLEKGMLYFKPVAI